MKKLTRKFVEKEIEKINYTYNLNKVIRYNQKRKEKYETQSLAEHVTNMIFLAYYFRQYEDPENKLDFDKIIQMIITHDMGEIETGDILSSHKTAADIKKEESAMKIVSKKSPEFVSKKINNYFHDIENMESAEAKYVQAIDKIEPVFFFSRDISMIRSVNNLEHMIKSNDKRLKVFERSQTYFIRDFHNIMFQINTEKGAYDKNFKKAKNIK